MTIYVIKTADGDLYFSGNRKASIGKAYDTAARAVIDNIPRLGGETWDGEEVAEVEKLLEWKQWDKLYKKLDDMGVVRKSNVIE